ncbi:AI-2E family transporter [Natronomonas halophila]|uniref:AI-2E family transporter n=1 Tax=Natronomonas halophila TaxID=2747817 RepID=UPI0015B66582|nr:AI-2E family transporter [Natronomonas halophila]QLD84302.1 AI-2E family transporter [Natronomonas halophila]
MDRTRAVLLGLVALLLAITVLLVSPFQDFVFLAILLFYPLKPLYDRLTEHVSPEIASTTLVVGATVVVVLPVLFVLRTTVRSITSLLGRVRRGEISFTQLDARVEELTGVDVDLAETLRTVARDIQFGAVDGVLGIFGTVTHIVIGLGLTMFLLYYLLKDADRLAAWLRATMPLPAHVETELYAEFEDIVHAVLVSHVLVAVIQGIVAGFGLVAVGIPNAVFWTVVMVFLAVLPIIGSFLVWGPAAVYLLVTNQPVAGTFLFVYGTIVVGLTDDYLRPIAVERYTETRLNPAVIILGVLGGVYVFGFMGVFIGPVVISSLRAVLDVYRREFGTDENRPV